MKTQARQFVTVRSEGNGFLITWTPAPNDRRRLRFTSLQKANAEADRIDGMLIQGHRAITKMPEWRLTALNALCAMLPDDGGVTLHKAIQFYMDRHGVAELGATVEEVGNAFILSRSSTDDFSKRQVDTVRFHVKRFIGFFGSRAYASLDHNHYKKYLTEEIGGVGKSQNNHLITLRSMSRWARDIGAGKMKFLPPGSTAAEQVQTAKEAKVEREVYSPEQFMRLLVFTPADMVMFMVLGQLAGIRAAERARLFWRHWRHGDDNKIVCNSDVTKTKRRRVIDVLPSLAAWLAIFCEKPETPMLPCNPTTARVAAITKAAGVPWISNALRAGFASYHYELYDDPALTSKNTGHSVNELETTYKCISACVTKTNAKQMLATTTPQAVIAFARAHKLPIPAWAKRILAKPRQMHNAQ